MTVDRQTSSIRVAEGVVFTTRWGGVSPPPFDTMNLKMGLGDSDQAVRRNRDLVSSSLGISSSWVDVEQVHGSRVVLTDGSPVHGAADALVTGARGVPLVVYTADCAPIALHSNEGVAAVHVGWRGLAGGLIDEAVGSLGGKLKAWVGPTIGPCHYEVGEEVVDAFARQYPTAPSFASEAEVKPRFDLPSAIEWVLESRGVMVDRSAAVCTYCSSDLFSFRRDGRTGRQAVIVWRP